MIVFFYDKSFEGLLTVIFEAYRLKKIPDQLLAIGEFEPLFCDDSYTINTDLEKSTRVWQKLQSKLSQRALDLILYGWLSEQDSTDKLLFDVIKKMVDSTIPIESNFADNDILNLFQLSKKVSKERHHLMQFVRFQKTIDDIYFAVVSPLYNALPLVINHFKNRFADQQWIIYDTIRNYGFYYDLKSVTQITLDVDQYLTNNKLNKEALANNEELFQVMWQKYFKALTIKERINPKLQRQYMPRRFWKYLIEKQ